MGRRGECNYLAECCRIVEGQRHGAVLLGQLVALGHDDALNGGRTPKSLQVRDAETKVVSLHANRLTLPGGRLATTAGP